MLEAPRLPMFSVSPRRKRQPVGCVNSVPPANRTFRVTDLSFGTPHESEPAAATAKPKPPKECAWIRASRPSVVPRELRPFARV